MTNEECIQELKEELKEVNTWIAIYANDKKVCIPKEKRKKALDMAIKALEQEPCEDTISRTDAMDTILCYGNEIKTEVINDIKASMIKLPPVTPQPKMGHWIAMSEGFSPYKCSECEAVEFKKSKYCPNCGAKMIEGSDEE